MSNLLGQDGNMEKTDITMSNVYELCFQLANDPSLIKIGREENLATLFVALREKFKFTQEQMRQCIIFVKETL
tara:strand:- start:239 stop:457 length:219 start_codon:yes stop_codon:yes gene_type:complete